jgi:hypothetical protein
MLSLKRKNALSRAALIETWKGLSFPSWSVPLVLLIIAILAFGIFIPWLGFYWDDWPSIWFLHLLGPQGFKDVFASDRPFLGQLFIITTSVLGERTLNWHIFSLLARWIAAVAFWWLLRLLWPDNKRQTAWVAILFLIYPGFTQQPIAVTYSHAWVILAVFIASLGTNLLAIRKPKYFWQLIALSVLGSAFAMFSTEYFFTLELLRPVLIWMVVCESETQMRNRIRKTLSGWFSFVLLMIIFLFWRIFVHVFPRGQLYEATNLIDHPVQAILLLAPRIVQDVIEAGFLGWFSQISTIVQSDFKLVVTIVSLAVATLAGLFIMIYLSRYKATSNADTATWLQPSKKWAQQSILLGLFSLAIAGWPFWLTDLLIKLEFPNDRFTLSFIFGSSLLIVGLIEFIPKAWPKLILLGVLTGLAVGQNLYNSNLYRLDWNSQKAFFQQLAWRAPGIAPGTVLMTARLPLRYFSDNSLTAPLNWMYGSSDSTQDLTYLFYDIQARRGNRPKDLSSDFSIDFGYRSMAFNGSSNQVLVLAYNPPGCLKLIDPVIDADNPTLPKPVDLAYRLSDLSLISSNAPQAVLPPSIVGVEPVTDWCSYFEKADLARQNEDWQQVAELGDEALALNKTLYTMNAPELIPYVEGYAHTGQWKKAQGLSTQAIKTARNVKSMLCQAWTRIESTTPASPDRDKAMQAVQNDLKCPGR